MCSSDLSQLGSLFHLNYSTCSVYCILCKVHYTLSIDVYLTTIAAFLCRQKLWSGMCVLYRSTQKKKEVNDITVSSTFMKGSLSFVFLFSALVGLAGQIERLGLGVTVAMETILFFFSFFTYFCSSADCGCTSCVSLWPL